MELVFLQNSAVEAQIYTSAYIIGRENKFGFPPSPATVFPHIPKNRSIVFKIFSCDFALSEDGDFSMTKLSEHDALKLAAASPIYEDALSASCYFRYTENKIQHTVWLEDFVHSAKKLFILKKLGVERVFVPFDGFSAPTASHLLSAYGNRI